jgi:ribonuclease BN (tRNA processing enzyme)
MELVTVGTGTVAPSARRTGPCHWVSQGDLRILLDCGAGALHRLAEFGLPWQKITHVVLTHFHPDHFGELPMLVFALQHTAQPPRKDPLVILGPAGTVRLVKALAQGFGPWLLDPGFPIGVLDVRDREPFPLNADVSLETCRVPHTPESVAVSVTAPEGRLVYTGDTGPSAELAQWAAGCDLLLAECSLPDALAVDIHLTPTQAGDLARDARAGRLVLTHFYPPVETADPARTAGERFKGRITAASDGDRFTIGGAPKC